MQQSGDDEPKFPKTRGECVDGPRPCPWMRCRYHLWIDYDRRGNPILSAAGSAALEDEDAPFTDAPHSCALDVADDGPLALHEIATHMGYITRERIRQVEYYALRKLAEFGLGPDPHTHTHGNYEHEDDMAAPTEPKTYKPRGRPTNWKSILNGINRFERRKLAENRELAKSSTVPKDRWAEILLDLERQETNKKSPPNLED